MHQPLNTKPGSEEYARYSTRLETAAERAGSTMGSATRTLRELQSNVVGITSRIQSLNQEFRVMASEVKDQARDLASEWKHVGRLKLNEGRERARDLAQNKPLHLLAAAAALAFAVGLGLRLWRSTRAD